MYAPEQSITNEELSERLGLEAEQIFKSSGIRRRRWGNEGTKTRSLGANALTLALDDAKLNREDVDYLLFGTMTPDRFIPGSSPAVQKALTLREIPCLDIRAACCNALYALQVARALVAAGTARRVAICLAEIQSAFLDLSPAAGTTSMLFCDGARALVAAGTARRVAICLAEIQSAFLDLSPAAGTTSMLFGDGASALIVSNEKTEGALEILDIHLATDGTYIDDLGLRCPGTEFGTTRSHGTSEHAEDYAARMVGQSVILQEWISRMPSS